ncbi:glycoside hydrolase 105 family protein [Sphingomonas sp. IBVSS2]|uniref:beta-galactosidase BglB n=1 Tax=Sphingomonas sp. IBVSS2 TaxID=1985172 RepID=UPI000A2DBBEB|nr:glycoside hydrolase family 88 protein [Sphingomonas sp. IBVSS2]OSZ62667.1 glycoside hydrolase 105 family protein [Sphingomonas sp. IBVSS2]
MLDASGARALSGEAERFRAQHGPAEIDSLMAALVRSLVGIEDAGGEFLVSMIEGRRYDIKSWHNWDWTQGVGLYGLARMYERGRDPLVRSHVEHWFRSRFDEPAVTKTINTMAPMLALACLADWSADDSWHPLLAEWAEWAMHELPRTEEGGFQHIVIDLANEQQLWDDTLMMTVMPLAKIGLLLGRPAYVEEAKRQFMLHVKYLADRATGLWFHGWTFDGRNHLSAALWARGNSWITMAIPDFIELLDLPEDDGLRAFLLATLEAQVAALRACQRADGLWPTILDDAESYGEASATAGIAYGLLKAVRLGLLPADYLETGLRAAEAVIAHIDAQGQLTQVSFGTPIFATVEEYKQVPITTMPYGQAMAILALDEARRLHP